MEMLLWAGAHDPHAVHVRTWVPELACLPAVLALEPWRLLARAEGVSSGPDGNSLLPNDTHQWECGACTMRNAPERSTCDACDMARPLGWGDFRYGADGDYPLPLVRPKICPRKIDAQTEAEADRVLASCPTKPTRIPKAKGAGRAEDTAQGEGAMERSDGAARNTPQPREIELFSCMRMAETPTCAEAMLRAAIGGDETVSAAQQGPGNRGRGRGGGRSGRRARGSRVQTNYV